MKYVLLHSAVSLPYIFHYQNCSLLNDLIFSQYYTTYSIRFWSPPQEKRRLEGKKGPFFPLDIRHESCPENAPLQVVWSHRAEMPQRANAESSVLALRWWTMQRLSRGNRPYLKKTPIRVWCRYKKGVLDPPRTPQ